ncbi:TPA: IS256 family transposase [Clostridium botulinum]|nr:IS256 family transposase [Clostridium botulinum]
MTRKIDTNFDYNEEIKKCKTIDDVMGKNGLIQRLVKDVLENILEGEMEEHLGRNKYKRAESNDQSNRNYRNEYKDILGIWVDEAEGAKFWLRICNDLKNRGVKEILIACMDGLKGLPQAIKTVFQSVNIQTCIVHQIRNSIKYIASKDKRSFMKDLKEVYKASTEELALAQLDNLKSSWGDKYAIVIDSWYNNWSNLSTFFDFSPSIRKMIYTTNSLEGFNRQIRKFTKVRVIFPTDESLNKCVYLATMEIIEKWSQPTPNWGATLAELSIIFEEQLKDELA